MHVHESEEKLAEEARGQSDVWGAHSFPCDKAPLEAEAKLVPLCKDGVSRGECPPTAEIRPLNLRRHLQLEALASSLLLVACFELSHPFPIPAPRTL